MKTNREIRFDNRFNTKAKRSRRDWKAKRKDRRQFLFDGSVKTVYYDEFARCNCYFYIPITETDGYYKRQTEFMNEKEIRERSVAV